MTTVLDRKFSELENIMANEGGIIDLEIPSFRVKRSHKKSRLGCINCKRRRVKCDEKQPSCDRCRFRGLTCAYADRPNQAAAGTSSSDPSSGKSASTSASPSSHASIEQVRSPTQESWSAAGVTDTELARHYLSHTVGTIGAIGTSPEQTLIWRAVLPAIAYSSVPVRRGMLTLAAMNLYFDSAADPETALRYLEAAEHHGDIFVRESRRQLRELQPDQVNQNLACSRLLAILGLAFHQVHRRQGATFADGASWTWLQLLRGVYPVNVAMMGSNQTIDPAFSLDLLPELPTAPDGPYPHQRHPHKPCTHAQFDSVRHSWPERYAALRQVLESADSGLNQEETSDIHQALNRLDEITQYIAADKVSSLFRAVVSWSSTISQVYLDMLMQCNPLALALYAHWLVLVILVEDIWWMTDMGREEIKEVCEMLSGEGQEVQMLLQWPRHIMEANATMREV